MRRRGLVHAAAWTVATGAAVALSWFGVHTVMAGTAYDPPRALPLSEGVGPGHPAADGPSAPRAASTHRPRPSASAEPSPSGPARSPKRAGAAASPEADTKAGGGRGKASAAPSKAGPPAADEDSPSNPGDPDSTDSVKSYATAGGRVVLGLGTDSAELVSATPGSGWRMQVWKQDKWLRVDFTQGSARSSVICAWNDHPPLVETNDRAT